MSATLAQGFHDPVFDSQRVFRAVMNALARPGTIQPLGASVELPAGLPAGLAAIALTLADHEAPLWLDDALAAAPDAADYLRFHTGAAIVADPAQAAFALVREPATIPDLSRFALGTPEYPDRSTTIVVHAQSLTDGEILRLDGPGIDGTADLRTPMLLPRFIEQWSSNRTLFPRGVDLILAADRDVSGLPRTTRIREV